MPSVWSFWEQFVILILSFDRFVRRLRFNSHRFMLVKRISRKFFIVSSSKLLKSSQDPRLVIPGIVWRKDNKAWGETDVLLTSNVCNLINSDKCCNALSVTAMDPWTSREVRLKQCWPRWPRKQSSAKLEKLKVCRCLMAEMNLEVCCSLKNDAHGMVRDRWRLRFLIPSILWMFLMTIFLKAVGICSISSVWILGCRICDMRNRSMAP